MIKYWKLICANLAALLCGLYLALYGFHLPGQGTVDISHIEGFFWPEQKQLTEFGLVDHKGNLFDLASLGQHWTLMFFGYTYCPDICPVTMSVLHEVNGLIQQNATPEHKNIQVTFISVDGERDNSDHLASYIRFYDEDFDAASGTRDQVDSLARQLGVPYEIEIHEPGAKNYLVSHSGAIFLISPEGKLISIFQPPYDAAAIAETYQTIRKFLDQQS